MAAAIRQDDDCVRHDLNPLLCLCDLYVCSVPVPIRRASGAKNCLLLKIPFGIFNQNALQNEPQPSIMVVLIVFGKDFLKTTCEANHDWFRIERDEDCR
jgi:hypothetical protein